MTIDSVFNSVVFARDSWDFWEPWDRLFLGALLRSAHAARIDYVIPFWTHLFFGNLDYEETAGVPAPPSPDEVIRRATQVGSEARLFGRTTATGRSYSALLSGEPTELTVSKTIPIVLDVAGAGGSHYLTELTLASRGTTTARVELA